MVLHIRDGRRGHIIDTAQLERLRESVVQVEHESGLKRFFKESCRP